MAAARDGLPESGMRSFMYERSPTHRHRGIDLGAKLGAPVYAAAPGIVTHSVNVYTRGFGGYGRVVAVKADDGTWQLYAHLQTAIARVGERVEAGTPIGAAGGSVFTKEEPTKEGPVHLHFEVSPTPYPQQSEAPRLDPVAYLRAGRVHPLTGQRLDYSSAPTEPPPPAADGSRDAERPLARPAARRSRSRSAPQLCACCGQRLPDDGGHNR